MKITFLKGNIISYIHSNIKQAYIRFILKIYLFFNTYHYDFFLYTLKHQDFIKSKTFRMLLLFFLKKLRDLLKILS